jgi:hypothetical protein
MFPQIFLWRGAYTPQKKPAKTQTKKTAKKNKNILSKACNHFIFLAQVLPSCFSAYSPPMLRTGGK